MLGSHSFSLACTGFVLILGCWFTLGAGKAVCALTLEKGSHCVGSSDVGVAGGLCEFGLCVLLKVDTPFIL